MSVTNIPIERIKPLFPRTVSEEGLEELATSIKSGTILQYPIVRESKEERGRYELIAGYRRYLAARRAGFPSIPCVIIECDDAEAFKINLIENIQRENLTDYEIAKRLKEFKDRTGYSVRQISQLLGKSVAWVENHLRMLNLEEVFSRENTPLINKLTEYHARVILEQPKELQPSLAEKIAETIRETGEAPSVRSIQKLAKEMISPKVEEAAPRKEEVKRGEVAIIRTPEDARKFFEKILKPEEEIDEFTCPGCGYKIKVDWRERKVEWFEP